MRRIPGAREVNKALRSLKSAIRKSLKQLNEIAGQRISKGDYAAAEEWVAAGKILRQFQAEAKALNDRWRDICKGAGKEQRAVTPLWAFYQPILAALVELGGEAAQDELEIKVEDLVTVSLLDGDRTTMARGRERWRAMVKRARKPLAAEGWIAKEGRVWRITEAGRKAAANTVSRDPHETS